MSRQLARLRSLISEIDEIQKQGQAKSRGFPAVPPAPPVAPRASVPPSADPAPIPAASAAVEPATPGLTTLVSETAAPGRIALQLTQNVVLEIRGETEIVEIRKAPHGLEILFQDGKAFHIPFKDVA